jgi:hypothetical protein
MIVAIRAYNFDAYPPRHATFLKIQVTKQFLFLIFLLIQDQFGKYLVQMLQM